MRASFLSCNFSDCSFINCNLGGVYFYNCNFVHNNYFIGGTWFMDSPILGTTFDNSTLTQNSMLAGVIYTVSGNWPSSWITFTNPTSWIIGNVPTLSVTNTTINLKDNWNQDYFYLDNL